MSIPPKLFIEELPNGSLFSEASASPIFSWLPLSYMHKKAILKHVHQAFYRAGPAHITELFSVKATKYDSRRSKQLVLDIPKKEIGRLSLRHTGTKIWNSIPSSVKDYDNVTSSKNRLKQLSKFINNFTFEKETSLITNKSHHFYYYYYYYYYYYHTLLKFFSKNLFTNLHTFYSRRLKFCCK